MQLTEGRDNGHAQPVLAIPANPPSDDKPVTLPLAELLPQVPDTRDRSTPEYLAWEQQLSEDVRKRGILNPLHVIPEGAFYRVLNGETRRRAGLLAGVRDAPVTVFSQPPSEGERLLSQMLDNEMRSDFTDMERAEMYLRLMELNNWTQEQLAGYVGKKAPAISKILAPYRKLPEDVRKKVGRGKGQIPFTAAAALVRLPSEKDVREVVELALSMDLCRDGILHQVAVRLGKKQARDKVMKLKANGCELIVKSAGAEAIKAFLKAVGAAMEKLTKEGLPLELLPSLLHKTGVEKPPALP